MEKWTYDLDTQEFVSPRGERIDPIQYADALEEASEEMLAALMTALFNGDMTLAQWVRHMRGRIQDDYVLYFLLGVGGLSAVTYREISEQVAPPVTDQWGFLDRFASDLAQGMTVAAALSRSKLYGQSARQMLWRGRAYRSGSLVLPEYPRDGNQDCGTNCRCAWQIDEQADRWSCTWVRHPGDSCESCKTNAAAWNPLVILK